MRTLSNAEVKAAARKAYDEKRLNAFHMTPENGRTTNGCVYRRDYGNGVIGVCALGAALNEEEMKIILANDLNSNNSAKSLQGKSIIAFEDSEWVNELQGAHDNWALAKGNSTPRPDENIRVLENKFRAMIGLDELPPPLEVASAG